MNQFKMIHHVDQKTIAAMYDEYAPVFVLSTGRSGSKFVAELLGLSPEISAFHEPRPTLQYFSNFASRYQNRVDFLQKMVDAARMEMVLEAYITGKVFVESNQCLTFFAPALAALFKKAKFVHLVRHPGDFVSSAARKGWHRNDSIWEAGRVRLADDHCWGAMDQVERLAWLWEFTNRFIRDFLATLAAPRHMTCRLEDMLAAPQVIQALFTFCGATVPAPEKVKSVRERPANQLWIDVDEPDNMKKAPGFPAFKDWPEAERLKLRRLCTTTAGDFAYEI